MRFPAALAVAAALGACGHSLPFTTADTGSNQPFGGGSPRRVTYNLGENRAPAWLPDESGFWYSFERTDRPDRDRCLALLPPDGGRIVQTVCDRVPAAADSTDVLSEPGPASDGRLAYLIASSLTTDVAPRSAALMLAPLADPTSARVLKALPYFGPDGMPRDRVTHLRWLGSDAIVFVGERVGYPRPCRYCPLDTVATGAEIGRFDLSGSSPGLTVVPRTQFASSVASGESPDVIYYTLAGDSRVLRRVLSSGADSVVHDFGVAGIARDVHVVGRRLVTVVGGAVRFGYDSLLGYPVQRDGGGTLHLLDLATGADAVLPGGLLLFRRPAVSPSGRRLVVEAVAGHSADLWVFDLP
jgi:hypothetical protein